MFQIFQRLLNKLIFVLENMKVEGQCGQYLELNLAYVCAWINSKSSQECIPVAAENGGGVCPGGVSAHGGVSA